MLTVTHPGKVGDLLWALATVKQLASPQVQMVLSGYLAPVVELVRAQPYVADAVVDLRWQVEFTAPVTPQRPEHRWTEELHLGLESWPTPTLIEDYARRAGVVVDPWEPWLTPLHECAWLRKDIGIHLSDEWSETKAGLVTALVHALPTEKFVLFTYPESRLAQEYRFPFRNIHTAYTGISGLSDWLTGCKMLVTCKSFARVMALGMGVPTVVVEPSVPRHNPVFDPPTTHWREIIQNGFDARELVQNVETMLERLTT